ncbi:hypothetical protein WMY93_017092 [Mugilogobius chulae]|uniref:Uncharacterized protein n=1 Tax=Mugilogobius chulae TaxID=88201 RepID=A0AAW0NM79_9GOBI
MTLNTSTQRLLSESCLDHNSASAQVPITTVALTHSTLLLSLDTGLHQGHCGNEIHGQRPCTPPRPLIPRPGAQTSVRGRADRCERLRYAITGEASPCAILACPFSNMRTDWGGGRGQQSRKGGREEGAQEKGPDHLFLSIITSPPRCFQRSSKQAAVPVKTPPCPFKFDLNNTEEGARLRGTCVSPSAVKEAAANGDATWDKWRGERHVRLELCFLWVEVNKEFPKGT